MLAPREAPVTAGAFRFPPMLNGNAMKSGQWGG